MTEVKHFPPQGQSLIKHTTHGGECACAPERKLIYKNGISGRFGSHQGRKLIRIEWRHNRIEQPVTEDLPELILVPTEQRIAAREDAWLAQQDKLSA